MHFKYVDLSGAPYGVIGKGTESRQMAEVRFVDVTKSFDKAVIIENFNLDIADGEYVILVGPSGSGKSTILRCIAGLEDITSGEIYIGDMQLSNRHPRDRDVAMVFQSYALYPHMTVYENMAFCLRQRKLPGSEIDRIVKRTAEMLGIGELLQRKPRQLSGGQQQRVAVGRTIVRNPKVFLFDEPLSNLDAKLRTAMRAELLGLHRALKTTTIYVTHDQMEAMTMGDRIVVMNKGCIQQVDAPENIYTNPVNKYVAGFIGSPPMNFVECQLESENGRFYTVGKEIKIMIPAERAARLTAATGKDVILGIRPEHISYVVSGKPGVSGTRFKGSVWMVELLGSEKLVYIRIAESMLVARLSPHADLKLGDTAEFEVNVDLVHVFAGDTEETII
jgi:multiple sugar transport system ATP-binding protein